VSTWLWLLAACAACFASKLLGYLAPPRWLERPRVVRTAGLVTAALLAALVAVQTVADGHRLVVDARLAALAAAGIALWRGAPFIVVVVLAAVVAAVLRLLVPGA
jgi:hypothetical protein